MPTYTESRCAKSNSIGSILTVGVVPPPNPLWAYVKSNRLWSFTIAFAVFNVIWILWLNYSSSIPSWLFVFLIVWQIGNLGFSYIEHQLQAVYKLISTNQREQAELSRRILDLIGTSSESVFKLIGTQAEASGTNTVSILGMIADLSNGMKASTGGLVKAIEIITKYTMAPPASTTPQ